MTKTEQKIINMLKKQNRISIESIYGKGSKGGTVKGGYREANAAKMLMKKNIIKRVSHHQSKIYNNGYCVTIYSNAYELIK